MMNLTDCTLPVDKPVIIGQGFNSELSHKIIIGHDGAKADESYSLDFDVEEGSNLYAVKPGKVVVVKNDSDYNYFKENVPDFIVDDKLNLHNYLLKKHLEELTPELNKKIAKETNLIIIEHFDGIFSWYTHLKKGGSLVRKGQKVVEGLHIGFSGNTGLSTRPHLHFSMGRANIYDFVYKTTPFSFKDYHGPLEDREINPQLYIDGPSTLNPELNPPVYTN